MFIMLIINSLFLMTKNIFMMGLILIMQTLILSLMLGKMNFTFWLSFIIFLIFIGGMLILFMYVICIINNNKMNIFNKNYLIHTLLIFFMITFNFFPKYNNNNEMLIFNKMIHMNYDISMNLLKLYNMPNLLINLMMVIYLFIMMIVISKIINNKLGPFYSKN